MGEGFGEKRPRFLPEGGSGEKQPVLGGYRERTESITEEEMERVRRSGFTFAFGKEIVPQSGEYEGGLGIMADRGQTYFEIKVKGELLDGLTEEEVSRFRKGKEMIGSEEYDVYTYYYPDVPESREGGEEGSYFVEDEKYILEARKNAPAYEMEKEQYIDAGQLAEKIKSEKVLFYTGSAISQAGGVAGMVKLEQDLLIDDKDNWREGLKEVIRNEERVNEAWLQFSNAMAEKPTTEAHRILNRVAKKTDSAVMTENIDLLHERAGTQVLHASGQKIRKNVSREDLRNIDAVVTIGLSADDRGFLHVYKKYNPKGKIIAINMEQPRYLNKGDYLVKGDLREVLPQLEKELESQEGDEELTEQEVKDLSNLWEQLGSGKPLKVGQDRELLRQQMWLDTKQALKEEILQNLEVFRRDEELEGRVREAPEGSDEKAEAQFELVKNYMQQLKSEKHQAYGTTPMLAKESGYNLNCVTKSELAAALFEDAGMKVEAGKVAGHSVALVEDARGDIIYADPSGKVGKLTVEAEERGRLKIYKLNEEQQDDLDVPYSLIVSSPPELGFTEAVVGNFSRKVLEEHSDASRGVLHKNEELIDRQDWSKINRKLVPEIYEIDDEEWSKERERLEEEEIFEKEIDKKLTDRVFGGEETSDNERQGLMQKALTEARNIGEIDKLLRFLEDVKSEQLPAGMSERVNLLYTELGRELEEIRESKPRMRKRILRRLSQVFHL